MGHLLWRLGAQTVPLADVGGSGSRVNLPMRCQVGTGEAVMIGGFIRRAMPHAWCSVPSGRTLPTATWPES